MKRAPSLTILWTFVGLFVVLSVLRSVPGLVPVKLVAPLATLLSTAFALIHGCVQYRLRNMLVFVLICLVVSNALENLSILAGFPFGHYHYTDSLGPRLFLVPLLIGPAYFGMGYLSWTLARLILGDTGGTTVRVFAVPVVASFLMVSWDLSFDPRASTVSQNWVWHDGGSYFGVPFSNFLGWYGTVYLFLQIFALYLQRIGPTPGAPPPVPASMRTLWWSALAMYGTSALQIPLSFWLQPTSTQTVTDLAGVAWRVQDINASCTLVSLFTMTAFSVLALLKLAEPQALTR
jgi:uncharacterized membrane protein